jgi:hypothetical protein
MADFGTGLRAHLEESRTPAAAYAYADPLPARAAAPPQAAPEDDRRQELELLAAELTARERAIAQREAELGGEQEQMALALARVLIERMNVAPAAIQVDELAAFRARRYGRAS